jgi:uncharacterized membrane protein
MIRTEFVLSCLLLGAFLCNDVSAVGQVSLHLLLCNIYSLSRRTGSLEVKNRVVIIVVVTHLDICYGENLLWSKSSNDSML